MSIITIKEQNKSVLNFKIIGISPLIQNRFPEKAKAALRDKHAGKRAAIREKRKPEEEFRNAAHLTADGKFGFPADGLKAAVLTAAHVDLGVPKTLLKKSVFVLADDKSRNLCELETEDPLMREDTVRVANGATDLRYRPEFPEWSIVVNCEFDSDAIPSDVLLNLFGRAGFGVGLGEMRPERGKSNGRFEIDTTYPVTIKAVGGDDESIV